MSRTIKIRIPVAIDSNGRWYAYGAHNLSQDEAVAVIDDIAVVGAKPALTLRFVVAEIDLPQSQEVEGLVEPEMQA